MISVQSAAAVVDLGKIDVGRNLTAREIHNLPLVSRNPHNFALLQPGVSGLETSEFGVPRFSANGSLLRINYQVDGNTNTQKDRAGLRLMPMSEVAIGEVKVTTSGYAPEFGQTMGLVYNAITPSGTNTMRGDISYRFRRTPFSAYPFYSTIDADELAYGNLAKYDTIMLGIRAYERRTDLKAYNHRLIKYVNDGGTLIVQYNKTAEFNQAQYGPYPALVSSNRVTDETAPVEILQKEHRAFTYPNRIRQDAWDGWVQERGLYFLGERDAKYTDLVHLQDPFEYNPGTKGGALVEARVGKGRWIYLGLGLWRQLPYGTVGAYQLMANLISLGKVPKSAPSTR